MALYKNIKSVLGSIRKFLVAPTIVSISGTTARTSALAYGVYTVKCSVDCFIKQGGSTVEAATTDNPLFAGEELFMLVTATTDQYLAGITSGASGSLYVKKLEL